MGAEAVCEKFATELDEVKVENARLKETVKALEDRCVYLNTRVLMLEAMRSEMGERCERRRHRIWELQGKLLPCPIHDAPVGEPCSLTEEICEKRLLEGSRAGR